MARRLKSNTPAGQIPRHFDRVRTCAPQPGGLRGAKALCSRRFTAGDATGSMGEGSAAPNSNSIVAKSKSARGQGEWVPDKCKVIPDLPPRVVVESNANANAQHPEFDIGFGILELISPRIKGYRCTPAGSRLNLVIPVISEKFSFGGVATAVRLFERLSTEFEYARIVVSHQVRSRFDPQDWPGWVLDHGDLVPRSMAFLGDRTTSLSVTASDFFLATAWFTAVFVKNVIENQVQLFPNASRRFVYFIQDYEPAFYPWSPQHAYAESTYRDPDSAIAVFNCRLLSDYFWDNGLQFSERYLYEPMLHPRLRQRKLDLRECRKERSILIYARPSLPRNAFGLIVEALRIWSNTFPLASEWELISAGDQHADVALGGRLTLQSQGKLSLDEYARHLSRSWIGLAFVFTPSSGYPRLEMAEFGAWVITNKIASETPWDIAPNIISVDVPTPEAVAERISWCCSQYSPGRTAAVADVSPVFRDEGDEFPFAQALVKSWCR